MANLLDGIKNKKFGLQAQITLNIALILFALLSIQNFINLRSTKNIATELIDDLMDSTVSSSSLAVANFVNGPLMELEAVGLIINGSLESGGLTVSGLDNIIGSFTKGTKSSLVGSGTVFIDNAFPESNSRSVLNGYSIYASKTSGGGLDVRSMTTDEYIGADWYEEPMRTGRSYITDLYYFNVGGKNMLMYSWAVPVVYNGRVVGVMGGDVLAEDIQSYIDTISKNLDGRSASVVIMSHTGSVVSTDKALTSFVGKSVYDIFPDYRKYDILGSTSRGQTVEFTDRHDGEDFIFAVAPVSLASGGNWGLLVSMPAKSLYGSVDKAAVTLIIISLITQLWLCILISNAVRKKFINIMALLRHDMRAMARGDLTKVLPETLTNKKDEWGDICRAYMSIVNELKRVVTSVKDTSAEVEASATEVMNGNVDLSKRTERQAASVEETASSMLHMSEIIKTSSKNSIEANQMMMRSKSSVHEAGIIISETSVNIEEVLEASEKIENITKIIENIAFQTNILALNAAVEAARAGEQGKGFAVVASEVRNLAQTTQTSVKDITDLVADVTEKVKRTTDTVHKSKDIFAEVEEKIEKSSELMNEISAGALEQQTGIEEMNRAIGEIDNSTQQNASLVEEASASSEALQAEAKSLVEIVSFFKTRK